MIMSENKLNDIIGTSLEKIRELAGTETVVGDPIYTPQGTLILPVSKISMGFATGGIDYGKKSKNPDKESKKPNNFGGGGGTGLSISPVGFLTVLADGRVEMVNVNAPAAPAGTIEQVADVIERSPTILAKIKDLFTKEKSKTETAKQAPAASDTEETIEVEITG
jgi:sporulation protein YtfJ